MKAYIHSPKTGQVEIDNWIAAITWPDKLGSEFSGHLIPETAADLRRIMQCGCAASKILTLEQIKPSAAARRECIRFGKWLNRKLA